MRELTTLLVGLALMASSAAAQTTPTPRRPSTAAAPGAQGAPASAAAANPTAIFDTTAGKMTCTLFPNAAPNGVQNFVGLATGSKEWTDPKTGKKQRGVPLYNGTIFHRVIPNFMIQGGDPQGNGTGGPGYQIPDEIAPNVKFDVAGRLAYANSGPNTNGSQFFITELPTPHLDGGYVILGQCDDPTVELVRQISRRARDERNNRPFDPVVVNSITITGVPEAAKKPVTKKPARKTTTKKTTPPNR
jgi:peptidyl-prolyl cis-trans isomerase A (cyclophilin A)